MRPHISQCHIADQIDPARSCFPVAGQPYQALINTLDGLIPIGELVEEQSIGIKLYDDDGITYITHAARVGIAKVYRIHLVDGFFLDATAQQQVWAHRNRRIRTLHFVKVQELCPGMYVRVYRPETPTCKSADNELSEAALAGWLQADGFVGQYENSTNHSLTIECMTANQDEYEWVMQHIAALFPDVHFNVSSVETQGEHLDLKRIRLYGEVLRPFVERYELTRRRLAIRVPHPIWTAGNDAVVAYVKSIFQAEGYVLLNTYHQTYESTHVAFAVISRDWVRDVQILLTRLGIFSRRRRKKEKRADRHDLWELDISFLSERAKFLEKVGFISSDKQEKLMASCCFRGKTCPPIRYSSIASIEHIGEMDVYAIQTASGQYLTNGILVHDASMHTPRTP